MTGHFPQELVLAIYATSKGFSFVLFEGPGSPFDWGVREIGNPSRNAKCLEGIRKILDQHQPEVIVIEDTADRLSRRTARIRRLYQTIAHLGMSSGLEVHRVEKAAIRETFSSVGAVTKYEMAQAIAVQIPAFAARMPPVRKPWMSQDPRQSLFDAVALGLAFYSTRGIL